MREIKTWILTQGLRGIWLNLSLYHSVNTDFESPVVSDEDTAAEIMDSMWIELHGYILVFNLQSIFTYIISNIASTCPQILQKSVWYLRSGQLPSEGSENNIHFTLFFSQLSLKLPQIQKMKMHRFLSCVSCIGRQIPTHCATREALLEISFG